MNLCPLCRRDKIKFIGNPKISDKVLPFIRNDYKVVQCLNCRFYFVNPKIDFTDEEWRQIYGHDYFVQISNNYIRRRERDLFKRLNLLEKSKNSHSFNFLDIGAGEGLALLKALTREWNVTGIDINDLRVKDAKNPLIKFYESNFLDFDFPDNNFDIIYMDSVLEHVLHPMNYILKIHKILRPGGVVYIGVPNEDSLFNKVKYIINYLTKKKKMSSKMNVFKSPYHINGFNKKSIQYLSNLANFEVVEFRNFANRFEFLEHRFFSKEFFISFLLWPIYLLAIILRQEVYYEVILRKY